jgi:hypothetical protein
MAESREKSEQFGEFEKYLRRSDGSLSWDERDLGIWQAGWEAGRRDALEEAAKIAEDERATPRDAGGSISRWDACDNVAAAIRALEESHGDK